MYIAVHIEWVVMVKEIVCEALSTSDGEGGVEAIYPAKASEFSDHNFLGESPPFCSRHIDLLPNRSRLTDWARLWGHSCRDDPPPFMHRLLKLRLSLTPFSMGEVLMKSS